MGVKKVDISIRPDLRPSEADLTEHAKMYLQRLPPTSFSIRDAKIDNEIRHQSLIANHFVKIKFILKD